MLIFAILVQFSKNFANLLFLKILRGLNFVKLAKISPVKLAKTIFFYGIYKSFFIAVILLDLIMNFSEIYCKTNSWLSVLYHNIVYIKNCTYAKYTLVYRGFSNGKEVHDVALILTHSRYKTTQNF